VGPAHYFLHVSVFDAGSGSDCAWLTLHKPSHNPACQHAVRRAIGEDLMSGTRELRFKIARLVGGNQQ
jgi:hypothetical protein